MMERNHVYNVDCLAGLELLDAESVDMFLIDLPYGETCNSWDTAIRPKKLWPLLLRAIKPNGAIVLFGHGKFTARMIQSCQRYFRYNLVWAKTQPVGFLNANRMPLSAHEDIMVFYKRLPTYNPQKTQGHPRKVSSAAHKRNSSHGTNYGTYENIGYDSTERFPTSVLTFPTDKQTSYYHPTQKPVDLLRWLIRTYTNPGELVVDCCCGSGSTLVAAALENRDYIGMDNGVCDNPKSEHCGRNWADIAANRVADVPVSQSLFDCIPRTPADSDHDVVEDYSDIYDRRESGLVCEDDS